VLAVVRRSVRSAAPSAAMRERAPQSGLRSVALLQPRAEVPPALPVHAIKQREGA
jgi:hypothetical protein